MVDRDFIISQAALDPSAKEGQRVSVMLQQDGSNLVLTTLRAGAVDAQKMDLHFTEGEEVTFSIIGDVPVHLTGGSQYSKFVCREGVWKLFRAYRALL